MTQTSTKLQDICTSVLQDNLEYVQIGPVLVRMIVFCMIVLKYYNMYY